MTAPLCACLVLGFAGLAAAQTVADAEAARGIKAVEDGDLDGGIVILDATLRRLSQDPARAFDLSRAYLYLGIAYLGKGHETSAKARFRDALGLDRTLVLRAEEFSPKVMDLFEKARDEVLGVQAPAVAKPAGKRSSKTIPILLGVGAAAAAGVALAAGGGSAAASASPPSPAPSSAPGTQMFPRLMRPDETSPVFAVDVGSSGRLEATVSWTNPRIREVIVSVFREDGTMPSVRSNLATNTTAFLATEVRPGRHGLTMYLCDCGVSETLTLAVSYPR